VQERIHYEDKTRYEDAAREAAAAKDEGSAAAAAASVRQSLSQESNFDVCTAGSLST
jgi:hypothetical protein